MREAHEYCLVHKDVLNHGFYSDAFVGPLFRERRGTRAGVFKPTTRNNRYESSYRRGARAGKLLLHGLLHRASEDHHEVQPLRNLPLQGGSCKEAVTAQAAPPCTSGDKRRRMTLL
ncbi:hypothetical protein NDU88_001843 [Pleurodeles waltl]|uniref:Uncharacterized protein n=1 Tax=Pleurodeles waltl TaxID=8319 RepID=A0AAV7UBG2_PLEWA|nr:hypothetical protein NDU88_001843 [Pleurodeles waltl]